jgi:hypothetical protein
MKNVLDQVSHFRGCFFPELDHALFIESLVRQAFYDAGFGQLSFEPWTHPLPGYIIREAMRGMANMRLARELDSEELDAELITVECEYSDLQTGEVA